MAPKPGKLDARDVVRGAQRIARDVAKTLGPAGKTFDVPGIGVSRDGVVIVERKYRFVTPGEKIGAEWLRELLKSLKDRDGAGRSVVIANRIMECGLARVKESGFEPKEVARGIDKGIAAVTRELGRQKIIDLDPMVAGRAGARTVGADVEVGKLLGQALTKVHDPGTITFTSGPATKIEYRHDGTQIVLGNADGTRVTRASRASAAAIDMLQNGAVLGGGLGLVRACDALDRLRGTDGEKVGFDIVRIAMKEPATWVARNANKDVAVILDQPTLDRGFDATSGKLVQFAKYGIYDPVSTATTLVTHAGRVGAAMVAHLEHGGEVINVSAAAAGSAAPPPAARPAKVERFTDVLCPRQVSIDTPRFAVVVGLTIKAESKEARNIEIETGQPVSVALTSLGVEPIGKRAGVLTVQDEDDEPTLTFKYRPVDVGHGHIRVEYSQAGHLLASVLVPVEVVAREVVEAPAHSTTPVQDVGAAPAAEWRLYATFDPRPETQSLQIELARGDGERKSFKKIVLRESPDAMLARLYEELENLQAGGTDLVDEQTTGTVRPIDVAQAEREIKKIGNRLWESFLPDGFRKQYYDDRAAWQGASVIVCTNEPWIPWELMRPYQVAKDWESDGPWCETMRITRWLQSDDQPEGIPGTPPLTLRMGGLTLIVPKKLKLAFTKERAFMLKFRTDHNLTDDGVDPVTDVAVRKALERSYDWVHAAAHGVSLGRGTGDAPLLLDKGSIKPSDMYGLEIERPLLRGPSFVFNACKVGHEDWTVFGTSGWAKQLVGRGAGLFIAPLWSVTGELAHTFAMTLYEALAAGKTVGEAVLAGRLSARAAGDPTWLAYCVYAHPNARVALPS